MTTSNLDLDQAETTNHMLNHQPWCTRHIDATLTCHRPLPPVAGHGVFLMGDPAEDPSVCIVPAMDGIAQLTVSDLEAILTSARAAIGGAR